MSGAIEATLGREALAYALRHRSSAKDALVTIKAEDFADPLHAAIWGAIESLASSNGKFDKATPAALVNEISDAIRELPTETQHSAYARLDGLLEELKKVSTNKESLRLAIDRAVRVRMTEVVDSAKQSLDEGEDPEKCFEGICLEGRNILTRGAPVTVKTGRDFLRDLGDDMKNVAGGVLTDIAGLDELLNAGRGLGRGQLGILLGAPKGLKTTHMIHFALAAMLAGVKTFYFSLEIKTWEIVMRMVAALRGIKIKNVLAKQAQKTLGEYEHVFDRLYPVDLPTGVATTRDIARHLRGARCKPGLVVVDYGNLLRSTLPRTRPKDFEAQTDIFTSLRALACEFNVPVWTAARVKREAIERRWVRKSDAGLTIEIISIGDAVPAICQTRSERKLGKERLFMVGSRIGPDYKTVKCTVDRERNIIRGGELVDDYEDDDEV